MVIVVLLRIRKSRVVQDAAAGATAPRRGGVGVWDDDAIGEEEQAHLLLRPAENRLGRQARAARLPAVGNRLLGAGRRAAAEAAAADRRGRGGGGGGGDRCFRRHARPGLWLAPGTISAIQPSDGDMNSTA